MFSNTLTTFLTNFIIFIECIIKYCKFIELFIKLFIWRNIFSENKTYS